MFVIWIFSIVASVFSWRQRRACESSGIEFVVWDVDPAAGLSGFEKMCSISAVHAHWWMEPQVHSLRRGRRLRQPGGLDQRAAEAHDLTVPAAENITSPCDLCFCVMT